MSSTSSSTPESPDPGLRDELAAAQQRVTQLAQTVAQQQRELGVLRSSLSREASGRLLAHAALGETEDRLGLAVEAAQLALWELDADSGKVFLAERWGAMLGGEAVATTLSVGELLARVHPDDVANVRNAVFDALSGKSGRYVAEHRVQRKDGSWMWILSRGMVVGRNAHGHATRMIGTNSDITLRKTAQEEALKAREMAETANRAKSEFLANISHEVRTPLNGIIGLTHLLGDAKLPHEHAEHVRMVGESARALLDLLNDALDFSTIEAGKMALERVAFPLERWLEDTVAPHARAAQDKGLNLTVRLEGHLPTSVSGDPARLGQVLSNLLGNAVKFTERGEIELAVMPARVTPGALRFEVTDTGVGIPANQQAAIFEVFSQADASMTRKVGGTGLGLAICDRLVRMMGGRIQVLSLPGKGSVFAFEVQLDAVGEETVPVAHREAPVAGLAGVRVLLAEDHAVNELLMRRMLAKMGCTIAVAHNGREAVEMWARDPVDVLLMDVQMPGMDGMQATEEIRDHEKAAGKPRTPIIAVTAHAMPGDRQRCLDAGMDGYVSKPVSYAALAQAMQEAVGGHFARRAAQHAQTQPPPLNDGPAALDVDKLMDRLGEDRTAVIEIAAAMRADLALRLPAITAALEKRDSEAVRSHTHALKGALSSITASRAATLAKGLETAARTSSWELFQRAMPMFVRELGQVDKELAKLTVQR